MFINLVIKKQVITEETVFLFFYQLILTIDLPLMQAG